MTIMVYIISDIHGCKSLFMRLLEQIEFNENRDRIIIAGDIVDKGRESCALLRTIVQTKGISAILGNHDLDFLKEMRSLTRGCRSNDDFEAVLDKLRSRFPDGHLLSWELVDYLDSLPLYYEEKDFMVVHAGIPLNADGSQRPIDEATPEQLVNDRRFRNAHYTGKTVFFGHTETPSSRITGFLRSGVRRPERLSDYSKIWLDCGTWHTGTLAAFCIDDLKCYSVRSVG